MRNEYFLLIGLIFLLNSCAKDIIDGNGQLIVQERNVRSFTNIEVAGDIDIKVIEGHDFQVKARSHSNIIPFLKTELKGETLEVSYKTGTHVINARSEVMVTMPVLDGLHLYGDATIISSGDFEGNLLELTGIGNGSILLESGSYSQLEINNTGQCQIKAFNLEVDRADIVTNGNGNTEVRVNELLKATINGNGNIYYKGDPQLITNINGNGEVIKK